MENVGTRVGRFPALGQVGNEIHLRVAPDQAAEDQAVEALRLRVGADAGVQVGGHGFDEEVDGAGLDAELARVQPMIDVRAIRKKQRVKLAFE